MQSIKSISSKSALRIADVAKNIKFFNNKEVIKLLLKIKEYYSKLFNSFISTNYEKALLLWSAGKTEIKNLEKLVSKSIKQKNIALYFVMSELIKILNFSKEISMLVS